MGPVPLETLLLHRDWARHVARALVADDAEAADLEQDLWVESIGRPPVVRRSIRGWIAATLRGRFLNRRRADARRARREESVARPEGQASTDDLVAEAEAHRRVVVEVMALAEPYRSAVLLRWFEDLTPTAIAARLGVPVETVRTRLRRALATLRARFGVGEGGDRRAMQALLAPIFGPSGWLGSSVASVSSSVATAGGSP